MARYIIKRLINAFVVVIAVSVLVFVLTRAVGNPINVMLPLDAPQAERIALAHQLGIDRPLWVQFLSYSDGVLHGSFGNSWWQGIPAMTVVGQRLPITLKLTFYAFLIAIIFGIPLGMLAALRPRSWLDKLASTSSMLGISIPNFWLGLMLILVFAQKLHWFYTSGLGDWRHWVLPAVALGVLPLGRITQVVRTEMLEQLREMYVVTARSKGLAEWLVVSRHALKNAGIAVVTMSAWEIGRMIAGYTVVIEVVFGVSGLGDLIVDTIAHMDYPLLQAITFVVASFISLLNLVTDLTYPLFNPRVKFE